MGFRWSNKEGAAIGVSLRIFGRRALTCEVEHSTRTHCGCRPSVPRRMDPPVLSSKVKSQKKSKSIRKGKESATNPGLGAAAADTEAIAESEGVEGEEWAWRTLVDSTVSTRSPIFTKDGK